MQTKAQKGFTLLEFLIYIGGLLALGAVLVLMIVQFYGLYREIVALPRSDRAALMLIDRLTKDLRAASSIDPIESDFGITNGAIEFDWTQDGDATTKRYYVQDGIVKYQEDGGSSSSLTPHDLYVSNFNLSLVSTGVSEGVRIAMEIQFQGENGTSTKAYSGFAILRESYD